METKREADIEKLDRAKIKLEKTKSKIREKKIRQLRGHSRKYYIQMSPKKEETKKVSRIEELVSR